MMNKIVVFLWAVLFAVTGLVQAELIAPGVDYRVDSVQGRNGIVKTYIIDIAPDSGYTVKPVLANGGSVGLASTSATAKAVNALAAVNASYFVMGDYAAGEIIGLLKIDGRYASAVEVPGQKRGALAINSQHQAAIGLSEYTGSAILADGTVVKIRNLNYLYVPVDTNGSSGSEGVVLFNSLYGNKTASNKWWTDYTITDGKISAINSGPTEIPFNGYVLSVYGLAKKQFSAVKIGDKIAINQSSSEQFGDYRDIIGAGPILVRRGVAVSSIYKLIERFPADIADSCAPRTAVGLTKNGHIIMVVADGRQKNFSNGFYIDELAGYMLALGCYQALNLDGGGSSTMVIKNKVVNSPSDNAKQPFVGQERSVGDILAVLPVANTTGTNSK
ncbi:MAG: phosphodiester glycosidase family protein [Negativicutes bacterium]|jgi:exopolysaccharide biosynthesis protein